MTNKPKALGTRTCACGCGQTPARWDAKYVLGHKPLVPLAERLWRRVEKRPDGCWVWTGYCHPTRGYGQIGRGRKAGGLVETHRAAWEVTNGPIPPGMFVCHRCDNPPCCNPDHLFLGTGADNVADMIAKGRAAREFSLPHTKLSDGQVRDIRSRYVAQAFQHGNGWRSNARELSAEFGITSSYLYTIISGKYRAAS